MKKKLLLIVDAQYDFMEGGKLPVDGATSKMSALADFIANTNEYSDIVMTADFHPFKHCSFKERGGEWPSHCVEHTQGASIYEDIFVNAYKNANVERVQLLTKGVLENKDEYSIFQNETNGIKLREYMAEKDFDEIHVCGIVGTVCVANTINDMVELMWGDKIVALTPFIANFNNDDKDFIKWCEKNAIKHIETI